MSSADLSTKRIGEYLLKGWTLLGDNCPNGCNVPLMRSRDKKELICCACQVDFLNPVTLKPDDAAPIETPRRNPDVTLDPSSSDASSTMSAAIDKKILWVAERIESSTSTIDLLSLVELAGKMITIRKQLS